MTIRFEHVMDLRLQAGTPQPFGQSDYGRRIIVPIAGGEFSGPQLRGRVLAEGSDWQLFRPDGTVRSDAHYAIQTLDGIIIQVTSRGILPSRSDGAGRAAIRFTAPSGRLEWLNRHQFLARAKPGRSNATHRLYRVL